MCPVKLLLISILSVVVLVGSYFALREGSTCGKRRESASLLKVFYDNNVLRGMNPKVCAITGFLLLVIHICVFWSLAESKYPSSLVESMQSLLGQVSPFLVW